MSATPLAGLKVLEFSHTVMGPTAGLLLAIRFFRWTPRGG